MAVGSPCEYGSHAAEEPLWGIKPNDRGVAVVVELNYQDTGNAPLLIKQITITI